MSQPVTERPFGAERGAISRIFGVFFSPGKTFESIARKPGWVIPLVILLLWSVVAGLLISSRLDVEAIVKKQQDAAERRGAAVSEQQQDSMRTMTAAILRWSWIAGVLFFAAQLFLVPLLYHGAAAGWGKAGKYTAVLSAYGYAQFVQLLKGALTLIVLLPRSAIDPETLPLALKSNLGALADPEGIPKPLLALLTHIDFFDLWTLALCVIALPRVTKLTSKSAAAVVLGLWAVYVLFGMGLSALGAAFGG